MLQLNFSLSPKHIIFNNLNETMKQKLKNGFILKESKLANFRSINLINKVSCRNILINY